MKNKKKAAPNSANLRQQAEDILKQKQINLSTTNPSETDILKLIHELEVHQIELELQNDELTQAREQADLATSKYIELFEFAPSGYFTLSHEGMIIELNLTGARMLRKDRSHLKNSRFSFHLSKDTKPVFNRFLERIFAGKTTETCEITLLAEKGLPVYVHLSGIIAGKDEQCLLTMTDITLIKQEQENLRQSEERYRSLFQNNYSVMLLINPETGDIKDANPAACNYYGWTHSEICRMNISEINTLSTEEVKAEMKKAFEEKRNQFFFRHRKANGEISDVEVYAGPIEFSGSKLIYSLIHDITGRKIVEEKLQKSEETYRQLIESISDVVYEITHEGIIKYASPAAEKLLEYTPKELIGRNNFDFVYPDDIPALASAVAGLGQTEIPFLEYRYITKSGKIVWVRTTTTPIFVNGKLAGGKGTLSDITQQKQANIALIEREEKFRNIFEGLQDAYYESSLDGTILEISPSIEILSNGQYTRHDLIGNSLSGLYADLDDRNSIIAELKKHGRVTDYEVLMRNKDGSFVPAAISASLLFDANKNPIKISGNLRNITERKLAEKALQQSNQKWEAIIAASPDGIGMVSLDGKIQLVSDKLALMYGYGAEEKDEFVGKAVKDFIDPSFHKMMEENIHKFILGETNHQITEYLAIKKDNSMFYVELSSTVLFDSNGKPTNILYVQRDITDRKMAETAIRESEKKFRNIFETMQDTYYEASIDGILLEISPSIEILSKGQYKRGELIGQSFVGIYAYPEDRSKFFTELFKNGSVSDFELMLRNKDGSLVPVSLSSRVLFDAEGEPAKIAGSIRDITKRKHAEEALRESESLYKAILNASPDDITITDLSGTVLFASPKALTMFGYENMEHLIGKNLNDFIIAEDRERAKSEIIKLHQGVLTGPADYKAVRADFTVFDIEVNGEIMRDDDGTPTNNENGFCSTGCYGAGNC